MPAPAPDLKTIVPDDSIYPASLKSCNAFRTPPPLSAIGNLDLLSQNLIALFCSNQCPGDLILKTYDLAQSLRDAQIPDLFKNKRITLVEVSKT
jgi:predicted Rossmann fold nucleotide-binding protein DprA/Smf involved in DNA uptake